MTGKNHCIETLWLKETMVSSNMSSDWIRSREKATLPSDKCLLFIDLTKTRHIVMQFLKEKSGEGLSDE